VSATPTRRKVLLHLAVPVLFFHFFEPGGELLAFGFREVADGFLNSFHGHTLTIL